MKEKEFIYNSKYIAYIKLTSWAYAIGGEHFSVRAYCGKNIIDTIDYKLSRSQTLSLNRKDEYHFPNGRYRVGEKCNRFFTEKQAIAEGIKACKKKWKKLKIIIQGGKGIAQPQQTIWCNDNKTKNALNILYDAMEILYKKNNDPWTSYKRMMQKINDKWEGLLCKYLTRKDKRKSDDSV